MVEERRIDDLLDAQAPGTAPASTPVNVTGQLNAEPNPTNLSPNGPRVLGGEDKTEENLIAWEASKNFGGFGGAIVDSFRSGGNIAFDIQQTLYRKFASGDIDPTFSQASFIETHQDQIPPEQRWRWLGTTNMQEAQWLLNDYNERIHLQQVTAAKGGFTAFTAGVISGIVDIDAPLMLLSGGLSAGAKAGINTSRVGRLMSGTIAGTTLGLGMGAASYNFNPTGQADEIMLSGLFGAGLGFIGGGLARAPDMTADMRVQAINEIGEGITFGRPERNSGVEASSAPFGQGKQPASGSEGEAGATVPGTENAAPRAPRAVPTQSLEDLDAGADEIGNTGNFSGTDTSIGARQVGQQFSGPGLSTIQNPDYVQAIGDAINAVRRDPDYAGWEDPDYAGNKVTQAVAQQGNWLGRVAQRMRIGNDFTRMMGSGNPVWQYLAGNLLEDASGKFRKNTTAATLQTSYTYEFGKHIQTFDDAAKRYAKDEQNLSWADQTFGQAKNWEQEFYRLVQLEVHARKYGRPSTASPAVKEAADALSKFYEMDIAVGKGRSNELPIEAYKDMDVDPTYIQQQWSGRQMQELIETARQTGGNKAASLTQRKIVQAIEEDYARLHPLIDPSDRRIFATAVVDRALTTRKSMGRDLLSLLQGDEGGIVRDALRRNGMPDTEIDRVLEALIGSRDTKARPGHTQSRIDVDFGSVSSSGIKMIDLLNNDIKDQMMKRMSRTSGQAALARMGIGSKVEFEKWIGAGHAYDEAKGKAIPNSGTRAAPANTTLGQKGQDLADKLDDVLDEAQPIDREFTDALWSYFSGGPVSGGVSPTYARIKKVTQLSLMNQLGLTSIAEFGPIAANAGWSRFRSHISQELKSQMDKIDSPLMQEFKHMAFFIPEEVMFNARFNHESEKLASAGEVSAKLDKILNKGVQLQGVVSGFYKIREMQQRVALTSVTARIFEGLRKADQQFSVERLKDMGFENTQVFEKYINNGTVDFDADGNLLKLNMDSWDYDDVQYFRNGMTRTVNQLVQKALTGESNAMFHKDGMGQLFWQLKSFPLLAMEKQFNRNMRMGDSVTRMTFINGLVFAGMAYTARQLINGNSQNVTPEKVARGALNYSNMTGWLPMWIDPVAAMLGLQDFNASGYSSQGVGSVVSIPAAFSVADRLLQMPGSAVAVAGNKIGWTEYNNDDIRNLQATPIIGNMYGMSALFNSMKGQGKLTLQKPAPKAEPKVEEEVSEAPAAIDLLTEPLK